MGSFDIQCDVSATVHHTFAALSDVTRMPQWYSAVTVVTELTAPPMSRGSRFRIHRNLPGGEVINLVEVTEFEPDRDFTLTSVEGPTPFRYRYTLMPGQRGTTIALHGQISTEGLTGPARFAGALAPRLFARGMAENLNRFRTMIERKRSCPSEEPSHAPVKVAVSGACDAFRSLSRAGIHPFQVPGLYTMRNRSPSITNER